jgi:hypothetical protein
VICQGSLSKDLSSPIQWTLSVVISVKRHRVFRPRESLPSWTREVEAENDPATLDRALRTIVGKRHETLKPGAP